MSMSSPLFYFLVALVISFIGTIPFGPINLTVVKTTLDYNQARGMEVALAAACVEIGQALVAIWFGLVISEILATSVLVKLVLAVVLIGLAVIIFIRDPRPRLSTTEDEPRSFIMRGLLVAFLNPQSIPFWIFAMASASQYFDFDYVGIYLLLFLCGIFAGKVLALYGFIIASGYLRAHLVQSVHLINYLLAAILLLLGLDQVWNLLVLWQIL
jgi:L-lysine exporter family protein LysE/ArgO